MRERTKLLLMSVGGSAVAVAVAVLMFVAAVHHKSVLEVAGVGGTASQVLQDPGLAAGLPAAVPTLDMERPVTLVAGQQVRFGDGLLVTLNAVNAADCPAGSVCPSGKETEARLDVRYGNLASKPGTDATVTLRSSSAPNASADVYAFQLTGVNGQAITVVPHLLVSP